MLCYDVFCQAVRISLTTALGAATPQGVFYAAPNFTTNNPSGQFSTSDCAGFDHSARQRYEMSDDTILFAE